MDNKIKIYQPKLADTARLWRKMLYSKIENIFVYNNLPKEIPLRFFNLCLFKTGRMVFYKIGEKYCVQPFSYNDILNWYYVPVKGRVVNPYLPSGHKNWEFTVDDEAVIYNSSPDIYNYRNYSIVADLIFKTANQLAENDISYYCIQRNHRLIAILTAQTDLQKREMDRILEKIYNGDVDITMQEDLVSHINVNPIAMNSTRSSITELIEFQQYVLANFYHSFGINSNYNLKREQLNSNEIDVNKEVLRLNIDDMLKVRQDGVEKINEKYGLNIEVSLNEEVYKSLLQEVEEMSQNETLESEVNENAEEEERGNDSDSSSGNERKSGSDSESTSDAGTDRADTEEVKSSDGADTDTTERHNLDETVDNENKDDKSSRDEQTGDASHDTETELHEPNSENSEVSVTVDINSNNNSNNGGNDTVNKPALNININVSQNETETSQNETEKGESNEQNSGTKDKEDEDI